MNPPMNSKLRDILNEFRQQSIVIDNNNSLGGGERGLEAFESSIDAAEKAITNLIKDLVRECKPPRISPDQPLGLKYQGRNEGVIDFEQNLLKALDK